MKPAQHVSLFLCVFWLGCGGSSVASAWSRRTPVQGPDGQDNWWKVHCDVDDTGCTRQASEACPTGYDVKDREGTRYLFIKCKGRGSEREEVEW